MNMRTDTCQEGNHDAYLDGLAFGSRGRTRSRTPARKEETRKAHLGASGERGAPTSEKTSAKPARESTMENQMNEKQTLNASNKACKSQCT